MAVIPDGLPTQLRWFQVTVVTTIVTGVALPLRLRPLHLVASLPALVLAVLVHRGATRSDWTEPTGQLRLAIVVLAVTVVAGILVRPRPAAS